ncbi:kinase-like protein [Cucurbitaria berberidis CBS 394.84]|uniref:Kinase-like protein n=1 Tax=Cucurbitaria berberidis CBS 394.84 TaxID=1168544 RepID=A0A9P4L5H0_9PLEO|nr:kinase-like protein [Cucurbitaria berberidis CBS 394.84]KAF1842332.1 kinase-like protein [Cucurbitaria berberidis CBS 394.84]
MAAVPKDLVGTTGTTYQYKKQLQERERFGRVWLATSGQDRYILKDIPELIFDHFNEEIRPNLRDSPFIRLPVDTIPNKHIFISMHVTKKILKDSLRGLVELHSQDIIHLDIKADNIMVDYHHDKEKMIVEKVQLTDLDNAAYLPNSRYIKGMLAGNENWRSPEAFFKSKISKPADMFSFGIVCIYAVLGRVIFGPDADLEKHEELGALPGMIRLQRQVSYFGDQEGLNRLKTHLGDDEISLIVLTMLWEDRHEPYIPYKPFAEWLDRITAQQALEHPWFKDV